MLTTPPGKQRFTGSLAFKYSSGRLLSMDTGPGSAHTPSTAPPGHTCPPRCGGEAGGGSQGSAASRLRLSQWDAQRCAHASPAVLQAQGLQGRRGTLRQPSQCLHELSLSDNPADHSGWPGRDMMCGTVVIPPFLFASTSLSGSFWCPGSHPLCPAVSKQGQLSAPRALRCPGSSQQGERHLGVRSCPFPALLPRDTCCPGWGTLVPWQLKVQKKLQSHSYI